MRWLPRVPLEDSCRCVCVCVCSYVCQIYECPARLLLFRARCSSDWRMRKRRRRGDNQVMRFDESVTPFYSLTLQCRLPLHYFVPLTPLCLLSPSQICLFSLFSPLLHALSVSIFFHSACLCLLSHPLRLPPPASYWCGGRCFGPPEGERLWYKKA